MNLSKPILCHLSLADLSLAELRERAKARLWCLAEPAFSESFKASARRSLGMILRELEWRGEPFAGSFEGSFSKESAV